MDLGEGTALRIESPELEDLHDDLAEALHGLLTPQDQAPWRPHVTIQNKVEPREARRLQAPASGGVRGQGAGHPGAGGLALSAAAPGSRSAAGASGRG